MLAHSFGFGGLEVRAQAVPEVVEQLSVLPGVAPALSSPRGHWVQVDCTFEVDAELSCGGHGVEERAIRWQWQGQRCRIRVPGGQVVLADNNGRLVAVARVARGARALSGVLSGLASVIGAMRGGVVLHSASVQWGGEALAFIGPSGAGKTTACQHLPGARLFTADRLLVSRHASGGWWAHSLPGGTRPSPDMLSAEVSSLPLAGILGLQHSQAGTHIESLPQAQQVSLLRSCAMDGGLNSDSPLSVLEAVIRLSRESPVARLHLRLGDSVVESLNGWLNKDSGAFAAVSRP